MDPHAVLGVAIDADAATIKAAYRRLAFELHPDRNPGDPEAASRFRAVSEAYEALTTGRAGEGSPVDALLRQFNDLLGIMWEPNEPTDPAAPCGACGGARIVSVARGPFRFTMPCIRCAGK